MPKRYPVRALKYVLYFFIIALLVQALVYFLSSEAERQVRSFTDFLQRGDLVKMALFLAAFGVIYPFIGFTAHKVPRSRPFSADDKEAAVKIFTNARFVLAGDDGSTLTFRIANPVARITRVFEDAITVNYADNPLVVEGLRRDAGRLARAIEQHLRQTDEEPVAE
jgi:hypothetical protein